MALPTTFNELAICAGYGGLSMGLREAVPSARVVCNVEREASSVEILVARMQDGSMDQAPIWSDLCTFDGKPWRGAVDIITAGIPCQPWSLAGKQAGFDDERHLGEELVRVVSEVEPSFVFVENVSGFVRLGAPDLLGRLASLGFDAEWGLLSASDVGAPHRRQRFFMLAYRRGVAHPRLLDSLRTQHGGLESGPAETDTRGAREDVGDAKCAQRWEGDEPCRTQGRDSLSQRGESPGRSGVHGHVVAHSHSRGLGPERGSSVLDGIGTPLRDNADGCHEAMGDTSGSGLPRRGQPRDWQLQAQGGAGLDYRPEHPSRLALFPPGPTGDWSGIPEEFHPATQSPLRGVANGPSTVLGRVDQLRMLGNGVVPAQAAHAFRSLVNPHPTPVPRGALTHHD